MGLFGQAWLKRPVNLATELSLLPRCRVPGNLDLGALFGLQIVTLTFSVVTNCATIIRLRILLLLISYCTYIITKWAFLVNPKDSGLKCCPKATKLAILLQLQQKLLLF